MRQIEPDFTAALASGATTLCTCWRLVRRDSIVLGFTDHDEDLAFDGTTFAAHAGLDAAEAQADLGFAVAGSEVAGAFSADFLAEPDLAAGLWDGASVETWRVDWSSPTRRLLLDVSVIGAVTRKDNSFTAELRSMAHLLDQERGRVFQTTCTADLGDANCKVDLTQPAFRSTGAVLASDGHLGVSLSLQGFDSGIFAGGMLAVLTGASAGARVQIKEHRVEAGVHVVSLWTALPTPLAIGDSVSVTAGCDKLAATCRDRFGNFLNFRGCPHMPGNDVLATYASSAVVMDGGSLFS